MEASTLTPTLHRRLPIVLAMLLAMVTLFIVAGTARAAIWALNAELTAEAEVPDPGPEGATGTALITIDDETNEVCYELTIEGLGQGDSVTMAHIHVGEEGVSGDVVVPLFTEPPSGEMTGCVQDVDPQLVADITGNPAGYYVNIHSEDYPAGAVRGQLVVQSVSGGCNVTVEPSTVEAGQEFVVSGDFGGAEIHFVRGENVAPPEDSEPVATVPQGESSFSLTFTAQVGDEGTWTIWAFIPATECGDSAILTVTAVPDTATDAAEAPLAEALGVLVLALALVTASRLRHPAAAG